MLEPWARPQGVPTDIRPSKRTLAEFSLASRTVSAATSPSRILPSPETRDTLSALASDTGRIPTKTPVPEVRPDNRTNPELAVANRRLLLVAGLGAMVIGILAGVLAMVLWRHPM